VKARPCFRFGILLVWLLPSTVFGGQNSPAPIPNSTKGFDKQYKNLFKSWEKADAPFKAYKKENERELMERFHVFAVPEHWFTDVCGPEQGPSLARKYAEMFKAFVSSTVREFQTVLGEDTAQVKTNAWRVQQVPPASSAQSFLAPLPATQLFRIQHFTAPRSIFTSDPYDKYTGRIYSFSYVASFIYIDGAFRFVGSCDCPFWKPCSTNDPVFEGQLVWPRDPADANSKTSTN
jgi:hypothetical protein